MSTVGTQLRQAREALRKTRAQVAGETGILVHELSALEHGHFDTLADDRTAARYVKTYAEYLGFVPDEPVAEFWAERGKEPPPPEPEAAVSETPVTGEEPAPGPTSPAEERKAPWGWLFVAAALLVLVVAWLATRGGPESPAVATETETLQQAEPAPEDTAAPVEPEPVDPPVPSESVQPAPAETEVPPVSGLRVTEYGVGADVSHRLLTEESDRFELGDRVFFWTRVRDGGPGDRVFHVWIHEGRRIMTVELDVGSANWRTWSTKTLIDGSAGRWTVEARDASGRVLARSEFACPQ